MCRRGLDPVSRKTKTPGRSVESITLDGSFHWIQLLSDLGFKVLEAIEEISEKQLEFPGETFWPCLGKLVAIVPY